MQLKYKLLIFLVISLCNLTTAQIMIKGTVRSSTNKEPLVGVLVYTLDKSKAITTDSVGDFTIAVPQPLQLVFQIIGYENDTVMVNDEAKLEVLLSEKVTELEDLVVTSSTTFIDNVEPIHNEVILESELIQTACCNLSESFSTNASVDVSFTDAVTGAKMIRMLGLDGKYVQINRENIPNIRGLSNRFGLGYIPGTWIQSIDVGKGAGSVVNGFESMVGQINLELKKPQFAESIYANVYLNSLGKFDLNFNHANKINEKWSYALLTHVDALENSVDRNEDNFLDVPLSRQINILPRVKYNGHRLQSQLGFNFLNDEKAGGQNGISIGDDPLRSVLYGVTNQFQKVELFGKTGIIYPKKPYQGIGLIYSFSNQNMNTKIGRSFYRADQKSFYLNFIYQNILINSFHQYKVGGSLILDDFAINFDSHPYDRIEKTTGAFLEYSFLPNEDITIVNGIRIDRSNMFGVFPCYRIHFRYQVMDNFTIRSFFGNGRRTPNVFAENIGTMVSSRTFTVRDDLEQEISTTVGGSLVLDSELFGKNWSWVLDYAHTYFSNQLIIDRDSSPNLTSVYNLNGDSYSHSMRMEINVELNKSLGVRTAYKINNVQTTIGDELKRLPFVPQERILINMDYATKYDKWKGDLTLLWLGKSRIPNAENSLLDTYSPSYTLVNGQVTRGFKKGSFYIGVENLFNFKQDNPIMGSDRPFSDDNFEGSMIWGPVIGRIIYIGARYKIEQKNK